MADGNITVEVRTQAAQAEHDWASHGADAFGLMAVAYEPPRSTVLQKIDYSTRGIV